MSIDPKSFTDDWQDQILGRYPSINQPLLEKTIYAFELLTWLVEQEFDFLFKGGTSLLLLLSDVNRLSIDIDVTGSFDLDTLGKIPTETRFVGIEEDERDQGKADIPKRHFEVYYDEVG